MASKKVNNKPVLVRIPQAIYDRLLKLSAVRSVKEGKPVSLNRLIVEAVERSLN